jgi:hypothetical protein
MRPMRRVDRRIEILADGNDDIWLLLHSGSRRARKRIAQHHTQQARGNASDGGSICLAEATFEAVSFRVRPGGRCRTHLGVGDRMTQRCSLLRLLTGERDV